MAGSGIRDRKILVVDDSLSARRSLIQQLEPLGYELHEASDGFEALDRIRAERFELVFTDFEMPRMSGLDLLAEIRSSQSLDDLRVVIVTGRGEEEIRNRATEIGTDGFLIKPAGEQELRELLNQFEKTHVSTQEAEQHE